MKANGSFDTVQTRGYTRYDAVRLIENDDGLFIKLNDPTFSRSSLQYANTRFLPLTGVFDCRRQMTTSTANLERTPIKFSASVLPYVTLGWQPSGGAVLSSNNQVMTITNRGYCGTTYFDADHYPFNHLSTEDHLLSVTF